MVVILDLLKTLDIGAITKNAHILKQNDKDTAENGVSGENQVTVDSQTKIPVDTLPDTLTENSSDAVILQDKDIAADTVAENGIVFGDETLFNPVGNKNGNTDVNNSVNNGIANSDNADGVSIENSEGKKKLFGFGKKFGNDLGKNLNKKSVDDIIEQSKKFVDAILHPKPFDELAYTPEPTDKAALPYVSKDLLEDGVKIHEIYWLSAPYSYVAIVEDSDQNLSYRVFEPLITEKEKLILEETDEELRAIILYDSTKRDEEVTFDYPTVYRIIARLDPTISRRRTGIICYYLERNFHGYGRLDPLMHDENIEDITCNGPDIPLFIYHRKYANLPVNITFTGDDLNRYVLKIAQKADKQLSLTSPLVDAALPGGARAQITYTDVVSSKGSSFTIRKFKSEPMTPIDLIDYGTYDAEIMAFIWLCVENRKSAIVVGGTASGKTSMMNAFSLFIPQFAKIVSIEDTREIQMPHKNWLPMKTRESASESGKGNVDMFSLLKAALRQRPEYIIVGEVRGSEAQTLFQAMNTGHTTYSTLHAGSIEQAINRLTTNPINVPVSMFGALDLMVIQQLQYVNQRMVRRCIGLAEIDAMKNAIDYNILYKWQPSTDTFEKVYKESKVLGEIAYSKGWTEEETMEQIELRKNILLGLLKHKIRESDLITAVFDEFTKNGHYEFSE